MKIATLAAVRTAFLHLKSPAGEHLYDSGKPVGIDVFGPGSEEAQRVEARQTERAMKRMQDNDNKFSMPPVETARAEATEDLVALTAGFRNIDHNGEDGQPLSGVDLYRAVYSDPELGWIKEQFDRFKRDWGKFMPGSSAI